VFYTEYASAANAQIIVSAVEGYMYAAGLMGGATVSNVPPAVSEDSVRTRIAVYYPTGSASISELQQAIITGNVIIAHRGDSFTADTTGGETGEIPLLLLDPALPRCSFAGAFTSPFLGGRIKLIFSTRPAVLPPPTPSVTMPAGRVLSPSQSTWITSIWSKAHAVAAVTVISRTVTPISTCTRPQSTTSTSVPWHA